MPKGIFYSVDKQRIAGEVSPVQQVSLAGGPVQVDVRSILVPEINVNVSAWDIGVIPISINVDDIIGAIPISLRAENIYGVIPISIRAENIEGVVPISIDVSNVVGDVPVTITGTPTVQITGQPQVYITNPSLNVSGSVSISGTPTVQISGTPSVSISGTPNVNITNPSLTVTGSVSISGTPTVQISGTPSVSISGTPSITISGTPDVNIYAQATPVRTQGEWAPQYGQSKTFSAAESNLINGGTITWSYTVPTGKNLYLTHCSFSLSATSTADMRYNQIGAVALVNWSAGQVHAVIGGNGGGALSFPTPIRIPSGNVLYMYGYNYSGQTVWFRMTCGGYEL